MTRRRKSTYPTRCAQMLGVATVVAFAVCALGIGATLLHAAVTAYFRAR